MAACFFTRKEICALHENKYYLLFAIPLLGRIVGVKRKTRNTIASPDVHKIELNFSKDNYNSEGNAERFEKKEICFH